jgi:hypothetical protein
LVWFHSLTVKQNPFKILSADSTSAGATFHLVFYDVSPSEINPLLIGR